jgi:hypothetical protein
VHADITASQRQVSDSALAFSFCSSSIDLSVGRILEGILSPMSVKEPWGDIERCEAEVYDIQRIFERKTACDTAEEVVPLP